MDAAPFQVYKYERRGRSPAWVVLGQKQAGGLRYVAYWYVGVLVVPTKPRKMPLSMEPPAVRGAVKIPLPFVGLTLEATVREPAPVAPGAPTAGNCRRIVAGTVKVPRPAVVVQMKVVESEV